MKTEVFPIPGFLKIREKLLWGRGCEHGAGRQGQSFPRTVLTTGLPALQRGRTLVSPAAGSPWGFLASFSGHTYHTHCCPGFSAPRTLYPFPICQPISQLHPMPLFPQTAALAVLGVGRALLLLLPHAGPRSRASLPPPLLLSARCQVRLGQESPCLRTI